jgi:hypothetical protein
VSFNVSHAVALSVEFKLIAIETNKAAPAFYEVLCQTGAELTERVQMRASLPRPWPAGNYRVDMAVDGQLFHTTRFTVAGGAKDLAVEEVRLLKAGPAFEEPVPVSSNFEPEDGAAPNVLIVALVTNTFFAPWSVLLRLVAVETNKHFPSEHIMLQVPQDNVQEVIPLRAATTTPWPVGDYRVDVFVDGPKLFTSVPFTVGGGAKPLAVEGFAFMKVDASVSEEPIAVDGSNFVPEDVVKPKQLMLAVGLNKYVQKSTLEVIWVAVETNDELPPEMEMQKTRGDIIHEVTATSVHDETPWPIGNYRVDFVVDGKHFASFPFTVGGGIVSAGAQAVPVEVADAGSSRAV